MKIATMNLTSCRKFDPQIKLVHAINTVIRVFSKCTRRAIMPILIAQVLLRKIQKKIPMKNVTLSGDRTRASHNLWFQVQHYPIWTNLAT